MRICKRRRLVGGRIHAISKIIGGGDGGVPLSALNDDILRDVLSRLSIRDLYRAKCVCKAWRSLVSSPHFVEMHSRRKHEPARGLLIATDDSVAREFVFYYSALYELQHRDGDGDEDGDGQYDRRVFIPRMRFSYSDYQWMTQVVDGLVCLNSTNRLTLVNLYTRETLELPPAPAPRKDYHTATAVDCRMGISYAIFKMHHGPPSPRKVNATNCTATRYHLGYDPVHKVYKVLSMSYMCTKNCSGPGDMCGCPVIITPQILTLSGPNISYYKWREVPWPRAYRKCPTQSFCLNGTLYWMHHLKEKTMRSGLPAYVPHFFSMVHEYFCSFLISTGLPGKIYRRLPYKVLRFRGRLTFADCFSSGRSLSFYSYNVEEILRPWRKDILELPEMLTGNPQCDDVIPVGNIPNGDVLLANDRANEFFTPVCSYNHEAKCFKLFKVGKFPPSVTSMSRVEAAVCIACLEEKLTPLHRLLGTMEGSSSG